jgi:hypothetical protein
MVSPIIVIENHGADSGIPFEQVVSTFGGGRVCRAASAQGYFEMQDTGGLDLPDAALNATEPFAFYRALTADMEEGTYVVRISNPNYPLHDSLWSEIQDEFPVAKFDYVLSTGEECALQGYYVERITKRAMDYVADQAIKVLPSGYLNGSVMRTAGRHWFSLALRRYYYQDNFEALFDSPRNLAINTIGQCNYTCRKCQYHSSELTGKLKRSYQGAMSLERYKTILEKAKSYKRLLNVYPTITGEPTLHPDIVEIVRLTVEAGYGSSFTTNASLLTSEMSDALIDAGIGMPAFSIDTTDPTTYDYLQEGGNLSEVERNILYFQERFAKKNGSASGSVNMVVSEESDHDRGAYLEQWAKRGFHVTFATYHDIFDRNRPYFNHEQFGPGERRPCPVLWHGLYLTHEGRLVSCGSMAKTLGTKDNIFYMEPEEFWRCDALQRLREAQLTGMKPGYCKEFTCWTGMTSTWVANDEDVELRSQGFTVHFPKPENILKIAADT